MIKDLIGQEIKVGDFVVFYSNIYQVRELGIANSHSAGRVKIMIWNGGQTAKPVTKYNKDMVVVDKNAVLLWQLGGGK